MGFYSIYKIFKDIIKTIFGGKFFKFLLIFILICLFCYKVVFGVYQFDGRIDENTGFYWDTTNIPVELYNIVKGSTYFNDTSYGFVIYKNDTSYNVVYFDSSDFPLITIKGNYSNNPHVSTGFVISGSREYTRFIYNLDFTIQSSSVSTINNLNWNYTGMAYALRGVTCRDNPRYIQEDLFFPYGTNPFALTGDPIIVNTSEEISNFSFDYLTINLASYDPYYVYIDYETLKNFTLGVTYNNTTYNIDINSYFVDSDSGFIFNIPKSAINSYFNFGSSTSISFSLSASGRYTDTDTFNLGTYTLSLTSTDIDNLNSDSDKYNSGKILEEQQKLNDNLTDSSIEDITENTLPTDNTNDITSEGVNNIFSNIYNAFCTGEPQDIVFPIPFTDKSITLSPYYVENMLTSVNATFVITLIRAFWWYLISRFIVTDIMDKINKIKSGNIENIETTNIRGDML